MSDQLLHYQEIATANAATLGGSSALIVHLQVWHYRSEGRSPENDNGLATLFRNHNLQHWEVVPLELDGVTDPSTHDQYVPVEVSLSISLSSSSLSHVLVSVAVE